MQLTCITWHKPRRVVLTEQEGCRHTGSIADRELDAAGDSTFSISRVVDWSPREGSSCGRIQACRYNKTSSEARLGADVGDEQDVAQDASTDGRHGERSSLLNLVAIPGACNVCQTAQGVDGHCQSLSSEMVSSIRHAENG